MSDAPKDDKAGGKKKPKLILILAGGLILGGGGFAAYLFLAGGSSAEAAAPAEAHGKKDAHGKADGHGDGHGDDGHGKKDSGKVLAAGNEKKGKTRIITREPTVVNLKGSNGTRYLKVRIGMEVTSDAVSEEIKNLDPQLSDYITEKLSTTDIQQMDNSAGRNRLRRELVNGINEILETGVVEKIYFTEFVIQ